MNTERIKQWTAALRSGRYTQAKGALATYDEAGNCTGHCCLGVLADIVDGDIYRSELARDSDRPLRSYGSSLTTGELSKLFDFPDNGRAPFRATDLMSMNDGDRFPGDDGDSFAQIADYIEQQCGITQENP